MSLGPLPIALGVPPVNLLALCCAGLLIARRHRRVGVITLCLGLACLFLLGTPLISGLLIVSLERHLPLSPPPDNSPQAIVILSGNAAHGVGEARLSPGWLTLERERAGAALARRTGLPVLVSGGRVANSNETLAAMMARSMAEDFGVTVRWVEPASDDTWENAAHSAEILKAQHIRSIYLVTHAWHMRRALIAFAHTGVVVTASPTRLDPAPQAEFSDFIPNVNGWLASYYALHEWIGCLAYSVLR